MAALELDECEYCGRPFDTGDQIIETPYQGFVCTDCNENKPWKY